MKTIAIINQKGGTSKSMTAYALCLGLAQRGFKVLAIDADWQGELTRMASLYSNRVEFHLEDLLEHNVTDPNSALQHSNAGFSLIASSDNLIEKRHEYEETALREALRTFDAQFDFCIIDAPPCADHWFSNILVAAQELVVPCTGTHLESVVLQQLLEAIGSIKADTNPSLSVAGFLLTRVSEDPNNFPSPAPGFNEKLNLTAQQLQTKIFGTVIYYDKIVGLAEVRGQNVFTAYPKSNIVANYTAFVDEFLSSAFLEG